MGSSSSRLGSRPSRTRTNRRTLFSSLICGGRSSRTAHLEIEDYPDEILVDSAEQCVPVIIEVQNSVEESPAISSTVTASCSWDTETSGSPENIIIDREETFAKVDSINLDTSNRGKCLSHSKDLVGPDQVSDGHMHDELGRNRCITEASTSCKEQQSSDPVSVNVSTNKTAANVIDNSENQGSSLIYSDTIHPSRSDAPGLGVSHSNGVSSDNNMGEVTAMPNSNYDSITNRLEVPVTFRAQRDESVVDSVPSDLGSLMPDREQDTDGHVLHVDVVSISSSIFSGGNSSTSSREARRNSRRLFWDAFSRRSSRRHSNSPAVLFPMDNIDDLESNDRWLLDFGGDFFDDGIGSDSGYRGSRIRRLNEQRQHSRSEIWERLRGGIDENGRRSTSCPSGLHPDGTCSCESFLMSEESSTRGSLSRIVMLAEALFEVLDEIHRQPVSLSLSMMSLPAPESVVDSFPLKNHKKVDKAEESDDNEQCYICLAEYEEGDKIRVLPCHHEYHMSCVDKWLKEIHGVCPLCRGDVRQPDSQPSTTNSEIPSI